MITKHIVYEYEMILSKKDIFENDGSIEHILDENINDDASLSSGNLVLLEQKINSAIPKSNFDEKKSYYSSSKYESVKLLLNNNLDTVIFEEKNIHDRFNEMSKFIYNYIKESINKI